MERDVVCAARFVDSLDVVRLRVSIIELVSFAGEIGPVGPQR